MRVARLAVLALLLLLPAASAQAAFSGSNGQVAWISGTGALHVEDPFDDSEAAPEPIAQATHFDGQNAMTPQGPPQWSPDGTKILYTEAIDNGEITPKHSAVFVINADGSGRRQVSQPFPGKQDDCGPSCDNGEVAWDVSPVWRDDDTIAFIRWVGAGEEAKHFSIDGTSIWTAELSGGESLLKHIDPRATKSIAAGLVWPATWSEPLMIRGSDRGHELEAVTSGTVFAAAPGFTDFDVSGDGQRIAYGHVTPSGRRIVTIDLQGNRIDSFDPGFHPEWVRFAPDGSHLIVPGCARRTPDGVDECGLVQHRLPDPDADVKPGEAVETPYLTRSPVDMSFPYLPGNRTAFDVQSQDLPVIYVPGFLGSEIQCDGVNVWMPPIPPLQFDKMRLQADGVSNAVCGGTRPTGKMVDSFLGADVYGHGDDWLEAMNPPGGHASLGWDWRKRPQESLDELDELVTKLLATPLADAQDAHRVSMVGHSYGSLLMRTYVDDEERAKKVARMLTVGAPYWGSPKPVFGLAFGIELPSFSAIDAMAGNDDMREFVRNAAGAYHLFPSDSYGGWLRRNGQPFEGQAGVRNWITDVAGGNGALLDESWATHRDHIDGFYDREGRIDYRSVTGVGLLTIGGMNIMQPGRDGETISAGVFYEDGDGTVTARSATQGPVGTTDPLGDDVHVQYRCGIEHMRQTADKVVQGAYARFLVDGHLPRRLPAPDCPPEGQTIKVYHGLEVAPGSSLADAEFAGKAQVIDLPEETLIVTNDRVPVELTFDVTGARFSITRQSGAKAGEEVVYGPVTGTVAIGGETVTVDGQPVTGTPADPEGTPAPAPAASPSAIPTPAVTPAPTTTPGKRCSTAKAKKTLQKAKKALERKRSAKHRRKVAKARKAYKKAVRRCVK